MRTSVSSSTPRTRTSKRTSIRPASTRRCQTATASTRGTTSRTRSSTVHSTSCSRPRCPGSGSTCRFAPRASSHPTSEILRSNLMNEAKFGINRFAGRLGELDPRSPQPIPQTTITGVNVVPGLRAETSQRNTSFEYIDNVSWFLGAHTVKAGVNIRRVWHDFESTGATTLVYRVPVRLRVEPSEPGDVHARPFDDVHTRLDLQRIPAGRPQSDRPADGQCRSAVRLHAALHRRRQPRAQLRRDDDAVDGTGRPTLQARSRQYCAQARRHLRPARQRTLDSPGWIWLLLRPVRARHQPRPC